MTTSATPEARLFDRFDRDEFDSDRLGRSLAGAFTLVGVLLHRQGAFLRDLSFDRNLKRYAACLTLATALLSAAYGAILGLFSPGMQTLYAALKLPLVVLGTSILCTPAFYVFNAILGSRFTLRQTVSAVLFLSASTSLVLMAFAPIAGFFTVSTGAPGFMTLLHLLICTGAAAYGIRSLNQARKYLSHVDQTQTPIHGGLLLVWFLVALLVALQMAYYFRPFLVPLPDHRFFTGERGLFLDVLGIPLERK